MMSKSSLNKVMIFSPKQSSTHIIVTQILGRGLTIVFFWCYKCRTQKVWQQGHEILASPCKVNETTTQKQKANLK
jgi:hypothetical protein